jgi:hypothetical protein
MSNASMGIVILPTTVQLCVALAKLAMTLDKRPDLTRRLRKLSNVDQGGESRKTLVEGTAESIQRAFTMCLIERSASRNGIGRDGLPEGKKVGIYKFANLVLKLLFKVWTFSPYLFQLSNQDSVAKHALPINCSPTFLNFHHRWPVIQPVSASHIFIILEDSCSQTTTFIRLSSVSGKPIINATPEAFPKGDSSSYI